MCCLIQSQGPELGFFVYKSPASPNEDRVLCLRYHHHTLHTLSRSSNNLSLRTSHISPLSTSAMYAKAVAILALLGVTGTMVQAAPAGTVSGTGPVEARAQPWREFKREAVAKETPELALLGTRGDVDIELNAGSSAG